MDDKKIERLKARMERTKRRAESVAAAGGTANNIDLAMGRKAKTVRSIIGNTELAAGIRDKADDRMSSKMDKANISPEEKNKYFEAKKKLRAKRGIGYTGGNFNF